MFLANTKNLYALRGTPAIPWRIRLQIVFACAEPPSGRSHPSRNLLSSVALGQEALFESSESNDGFGWKRTAQVVRISTLLAVLLDPVRSKGYALQKLRSKRTRGTQRQHREELHRDRGFDPARQFGKGRNNSAAEINTVID